MRLPARGCIYSSPCAAQTHCHLAVLTGSFVLHNDLQGTLSLGLGVRHHSITCRAIRLPVYDRHTCTNKKTNARLWYSGSVQLALGRNVPTPVPWWSIRKLVPHQPRVVQAGVNCCFRFSLGCPVPSDPHSNCKAGGTWLQLNQLGNSCYGALAVEPPMNNTKINPGRFADRA